MRTSARPVITTFYQSAQFEFTHDRMVRRPALGGDITFSDSNPRARDRLLAYFDVLTHERSGVLHGEYILLENGLVMVDRKGVCTAVNMAWEDAAAPQAALAYSTSPFMAPQIRGLIDAWDDIPLVADTPLLSDPYAANFFHFCLELMPRIRYFENTAQTGFLVPHASMGSNFQLDLMRRTMGHLICMPFATAIRVRDPILAHDVMNDDSLFWLRRTTDISVQPGSRRIYIRRGAQGTRDEPGGGLAETPALLQLLQDFRFEIVDFGDGEHGVAAQAAMLDGVGLILCSHGAALTNLSYLTGPVSVIEVMGPQAARACFIHIAAALGLAYHGLYSEAHDEEQNIVVDTDELYEVLVRHTAL
jgi:hypothetical protein